MRTREEEESVQNEAVGDRRQPNAWKLDSRHLSGYRYDHGQSNAEEEGEQEEEEEEEEEEQNEGEGEEEDREIDNWLF